MQRFAKIIIILFFLGSATYASALSVEYSTFLSSKGTNIIESFDGIGTKQYFLCSLTTFACQSTKKTSLGAVPALVIKKSLKNELTTANAMHLTLSPSGKYIAYSTNENSTRTLTLRNITTNTTYSISNPTPYWDLTNEQSTIFQFSPDNKTLVHLDDRDGYLALYKVDLKSLADGTFTSIKMKTSPLTITDFVFTDSTTLYYIGNKVENPYLWSLYRLDLTTDKETILESNVSYVDPLKKIGALLLFNVLGTQGYIPETYNVNTKKLKTFTVPGINAAKSKVLLANQEAVLTDTVKGVLMRPEGEDMSKSYPLVIWLHGGPYRQTSYGYQPYHSYGGYDTILESLRQSGVIVLKLDYRGSFGFGRAFSESIKGSIGLGDITDVMNALTYAKNRYHISNTYLMGNSYGGYLSLRALEEHPESFTGVVSINGVTDWASLTTRLITSIFNTQFDGVPSALNQSLYDQASILSRLGSIGNQKVSIIAGEADRTIPYWQATTLYDAMKLVNKNVTLVTYPGEDHVYAQKKTYIDLCNQLFNFVGVPVNPECNK